MHFGQFVCRMRNKTNLSDTEIFFLSAKNESYRKNKYLVSYRQIQGNIVCPNFLCNQEFTYG